MRKARPLLLAADSKLPCAPLAHRRHKNALRASALRAGKRLQAVLIAERRNDACQLHVLAADRAQRAILPPLLHDGALRRRSLPDVNGPAPDSLRGTPRWVVLNAEIAHLNSGGLIRPDFRAFFARAANGFFQSRHLTSETNPTFSSRSEAPAVPGVAFCLR